MNEKTTPSLKRDAQEGNQLERPQHLAQNTAKDLTNTLEKTSLEQVDYTTYLLHAPAEAKTFFESMIPEHQADAMQHIEYLLDGIRFLDDAGKEICVMDNKDLTAPEEPGKIETVNGVTFFQRDAMMDYTKENNIAIPTDRLREKMLRVMPARDYTGKYARCQAGLQLHRLLGGKLSGYRRAGKASNVGDYGYFRSSAEYDSNDAFALVSDKDRGGLYDSFRTVLFPVRALRTA